MHHHYVDSGGTRIHHVRAGQLAESPLMREGHYAVVQVPEKVNPLLADGLVIPRELVPER
jgi:hypothetical protein